MPFAPPVSITEYICAVRPVAMWFAQAIVLTRSSHAGDYCFPVMKYASMTRPMICLPSSPEWTKSRL